jgi:hypothetical protein
VIAIVAVVAIEAGWRALRNQPGGLLAERLEVLVIIGLLITSAGGLGLLAGGAGPREPLHFLYALIALGALPVAHSFSKQASPRRRALISLVAALVVLVLLARLFQTG